MNNRLDRQQFLGAHSDKILATTRAGIVGLGGGGSHIVQQLAHLGTGEFCVFDGDYVDETNLNRLVGATVQDAEGKTLKVVVAERVIKALNRDAVVIAVLDRWQTRHELLRTCAVVFGCVDRFDEREELETYCRRFLIPYIDVGMDIHNIGDQFAISGQVVLSVPGGPCMKCLGFLEHDQDEKPPYLDAGGRPQVVWPNGVLASTAVGLFVQMVTPWCKPKAISSYLEYDGNTHQVRISQQLRFVPTSCSHFPVRDIGDPFWQLTGPDLAHPV